MRTILECARALQAGEMTARALVEDCLARIADPNGEGSRAFRKVYAAEARAMADAVDMLRRSGRAPSPYAGIPVSLKDLFDVAGEPTPAASRILQNAAPAKAHAPVVARLLAQGFISIGRTNMSEFAYSGLGTNPHFGTPRSPWQRNVGHVPGGSSSGAAISVADGMAVAALGTDTGGSCRIPAAYSGVTGYKPTARRVPREGVLPLSTTLDSIGPFANSVACCAVVDAVIAGAPVMSAPQPAAMAGLRFAMVQNVAMENLEAPVAAAFSRALTLLSKAGARISERRFEALDELPEATAKGGFSAAEAFAWHRQLLQTHKDLYDPRVRVRIELGRSQSAADYVDLCSARARLMARLNAETAEFDALLMPTTPILPPPLAALETDDAYFRYNALSVQNTVIANVADRCAISLPCHKPDEPPVGLMLMGETLGDARLFAVAAAVEAVLAQLRS